MPMDSNQVAAMLQQQNSMFAGMASYAQQITPPMGAGPGMGIGFNSGPAPIPPPMPMTSSWHPGMMGGMAMPFGPPSAGGAQAMGESLLGTGLAGFSTATQGLGTLSGYAGLGAAGMGLLGMGGSSLAMGLSVAGSAPVALGLGAMGHGAQNMYQGFQQRQQVNQVLRSRFGNVMGIGGGRGGMGFSSGEMGGISSMLREMGTEDLSSNMEELTRVMGKTADMGLYRGVQSAREFKQKFQTTVDSLKEIAEIMHTTLEGATSFMSQGRSMGFFTGQDISNQLAATRVMSSATGMSVEQTSALAQQGAQFARATGGRGRQGAQAGLLSGGRIAMAQSMGILSDEATAFATGGLTGAEGAAALSGRMQETSMRFMQRGAGRAMVAGLWDPSSGGINQERLNAVMSGSMNIRELLNQGRRSISATGGRRSEFFRDEEQLRNQVLAQGGEYLPMAVYGTHLAEKRGLSMNDPIVQRQMRRRFRMSQGEVEAATEMMQNMPQIQAEFITKGRQIREQEAAGANKELRGIQGLGKRLGRVWEREVQNPFRQFADNLTSDVSRGIEGIVDSLEGRISTQMSQASKQLIMERSEFGQAVSAQGKRAGDFGAGAYRDFMQANQASGSYMARQGMERQIGQMLGLRPDYDGSGQKMYEGGFDIAGQGIANAASFMITGGGLTGADASFGLRHMAKSLGIEGLTNELRGYSPGSMSRGERAAALGYTGKGSVEDFLRTAGSQMKRDLGYDRGAQKRLSQEHADLMYGTLMHSDERRAWRESYQRGFGGVRNVIQKMQRLGSPELKAAANKALKGTKAEQVAFVRMLEDEGGLSKDLRVTDELSRTLGDSFRDYEGDIEGIRGRRSAAMASLEGETRERSALMEEVGGGARGVLAVWSAGASELFGLGTKVQDLIGNTTGGVSGDDMETFLGDTEAREAYVKWQTGSPEEKRAGLRELEGMYAKSMDAGRKSTFERLKNLADSGSEKGKKALLTIAQSFNAEDYRARIEVENDLGKQLSSAMDSASVTALGSEGRAAWKTLSEVARLRSSSNPDDIARSYQVEHDLMKNIVGTQAGKDIRTALRGKEGGEFVLAGLEGAEGYFARFGGGERGSKMNNQVKISNIMQAMLDTEGMNLGDQAILEAFGTSRQQDIINILSKGGSQSKEAINKILTTAEEGGLKGGRLASLRKRLGDVSSALQDSKISQEEARELAGGLGGRIAGAARARSDAEKTATADGQKIANKHLSAIASATALLANGSAGLNLSKETLAALQGAVKKSAKAGPE